MDGFGVGDMEIKLKPYQFYGLRELLGLKQDADKNLAQAITDLGLDPLRHYEITDDMTIREVQGAPDNLPL